MSRLLSFISLVLLVAIDCVPAGAAVLVQTFDSFGSSPTLAIPDGNPSGVTDNRTISTDITSISSVTVSLNISGSFNGDLYGYLEHDNELAVLVNRPGRTATDSTGYADSGLNITLSDNAPNDIHLYQMVQVPSSGTPLTGTWQPDARAIDPDQVLDTSSRTAFLSTFNGTDANGNWTLYLADLNSGGTSTLNSWSLSLTGVPEPQDYLLVAGMALFSFAAWRRLRLGLRLTQRRFKEPPGPVA